EGSSQSLPPHGVRSRDWRRCVRAPDGGTRTGSTTGAGFRTVALGAAPRRRPRRARRPPVHDPLPSDPPEHPRVLARLCEEFARTAGEHVRNRAGDHGGVAATKSSAVDVVTAVDTESEALLREMIARARPDDALLGEEAGTSTGTSVYRKRHDSATGVADVEVTWRMC